MGKSCFKEIKKSIQLRIALGLQMPYRIPVIYAMGKVYIYGCVCVSSNQSTLLSAVDKSTNTNVITLCK